MCIRLSLVIIHSAFRFSDVEKALTLYFSNDDSKGDKTEQAWKQYVRDHNLSVRNPTVEGLQQRRQEVCADSSTTAKVLYNI